jgi:hypothetical protein
MLDRLTVICLLGFILVSVPWTEAFAQTKCASGSRFACKTLGGTKICACWKTGSEICETEITGLVGIQNCVPGSTCPVVTCSVFGTEDLGDGSCDPSTPDPDCGIKGLSFCVSPTSKVEKQSIILDAVLTDQTDITRCVRRSTGRDGRSPTGNQSQGCTNTIELEPTNCPNCCKTSASEFLTFTATKFNGVACVCPGGYSEEGICCADSQRYYGCCVNEGEEICVAQQCSANLTRYSPGKITPYTCTPLPDFELQ